MSTDLYSTTAHTKKPSEVSAVNLDYPSIHEKPPRPKIVLGGNGKYLKFASRYDTEKSTERRKKVRTALGSRKDRRSMQVGSYNFNESSP